MEGNQQGRKHRPETRARARTHTHTHPTMQQQMHKRNSSVDRHTCREHILQRNSSVDRHTPADRHTLNVFSTQTECVLYTGTRQQTGTHQFSTKFSTWTSSWLAPTSQERTHQLSKDRTTLATHVTNAFFLFLQHALEAFFEKFTKTRPSCRIFTPCGDGTLLSL